MNPKPTPESSVAVSPLYLATLIGLIGLGSLVFLLVALSHTLTPFLLAAILAYLLTPLVDWLARRRWPRWLGSIVVITAFIVLVSLIPLIILPIVQKEVLQVQAQLPIWMERLNNWIAPLLHDRFGLRVRFDATSLRSFLQERWHLASDDIISVALSYARSGWGALLSVLANLFLVPIVLFYLLIDWWRLIEKGQRIVPRRWSRPVADLAAEIDALLSQFLRGQLSLMALLATYYAAALSLAGFDIAIPIGLITGLLVFIPYLGFSLGLFLATLAALLQFGDWQGLLLVGVIYGFGQFLETFVLTPRLVGERIGLHPLAVIFALLAFGELFGFFGILLALPVSAMLLVGLRRIKTLYVNSLFYRR